MSLAMTAADREAFLAQAHVGVLAVADEDGRALLAMPVWYLYQPGGEVGFSTGGGSRKMALIRAAGRVSLVAQAAQLPYRYVSVEGPVTSMEPATPAPAGACVSAIGTSGRTRTCAPGFVGRRSFR